jgi:hypothetical protein
MCISFSASLKLALTFGPEAICIPAILTMPLAACAVGFTALAVDLSLMAMNYFLDIVMMLDKLDYLNKLPAGVADLTSRSSGLLQVPMISYSLSAILSKGFLSTF